MTRTTGLAILFLLLATASARAQEVAATPPDYPRAKLSGYVFADAYANLAGDPAHRYSGAGADSGQVNIDGANVIARGLSGFQIRRAYLQLDNDLSAKYSTRVRLEADNRSLTSDGKVGVAVKAAYLQVRNVYSRADLFFGIVTTPAFENAEAYWGYRSAEKTIADFRGIAPAADQGAVLKGALDAKRSLGYVLVLANGPGNKPETNRQKRYGIALPLRWKDLRLEPYADYEDAWGGKDRATYKLFAGCDLPAHSAVGYEWVQYVKHAPAGPSTKQVGHSLFARFAPRPELAAFARVDLWDPDRNAPDRVKQQLWIGGLDWQPARDVHVIPNVEAIQYRREGRGVVPPHHDLQARLTFHYLFSGPQS